MYMLYLSKVNNHLLDPVNIDEVVSSAIFCQYLYFIPEHPLIVVVDCHVIGKVYNGIVALFGNTVLSVQHGQEDTTMWAYSTECYCWRWGCPYCSCILTWFIVYLVWRPVWMGWLCWKQNGSQWTTLYV